MRNPPRLGALPQHILGLKLKYLELKFRSMDLNLVPGPDAKVLN